MFVIFFMFILDRNVDSYRDTDPYTVIFIGNAWLIAVLPPLQQLQVAPDGLPDGVVVQDWESHTRSILSPAGIGLGGNVHTVAISHSLDDAGGLWSCESPVQTSHGLTSGIPKIERSSLKAMTDEWKISFDWPSSSYLCGWINFHSPVSQPLSNVKTVTKSSGVTLFLVTTVAWGKRNIICNMHLYQQQAIRRIKKELQKNRVSKSDLTPIETNFYFSFSHLGFAQNFRLLRGYWELLVAVVE